MLNLKGRDFLTLKDYSPEEILYLIDLSKKLKNKKKSGKKDNLLNGKNIVIIFEKTSTRTRCAFEVGAYDEGACVTYIGPNDSQFGKKESVEDSAEVFARYYDGIEYRGAAHTIVEDLAKYSSVPVWNGLTDSYHPTQILCDFLTVSEHVKKPFHKIKFVYAGDARSNMGNSLLIGATKVGMHFVSYAPKELFPAEDLVAEMKELAKKTGAVIELTSDINKLEGADVVYTDVWVSMGETNWGERIKLLRSYQVSMDLMKKTKNDNVIFLHCLPAFHDLKTKVGKEMEEKFNVKEMEVTDEVFRSKASKVFDQAENRMHTIKAVMLATLIDSSELEKSVKGY